MLIIGLTGGIGSGKSVVASCFAELGITVIDADIIAREVIVSGTSALKKIVEHFGLHILDEKGQLKRDKLRQIIFSNPDERNWLENLLHPLIRKELQRQAKTATSPYCILIIPLLLEKNVRLGIDRILVVDAPEELQIQRVRQRDQLTTDQIKTILRTQLSREKRLAMADDMIHNDGTLADLKQQVQELHKCYLQLTESG